MRNETALAARNKSIWDALLMGAGVTDLAKAHGLHRNRIYQIKNEMARLKVMGLEHLPPPKIGGRRKRTLYNGCYGKAGPPAR